MKQQWSSARRRAAIVVAAGGMYAAVAMLTGTQRVAASGSDSGGTTLSSAQQFLLRGVKVPEPADLATYVANRQAAIALGKALFWDAQVGSDGTTACASCHFNAGGDNRAHNTMNPGHDGAFSAGHGPNSTRTAADYPFHRLADPNNRASAVIADSDDVEGSQGVFLRSFGRVGGTAVDACTDVADATFSVGGLNVRRVTGRQAPTNINAVFNFRNFWDGRARENFNGANPGGQTDPNARVYRNIDGVLTPVSILIANSSAASQATGPMLSGTEMSCDGRTRPQVGRKMLGLVPLGTQHVDSTDSVLGAMVNSNGIGLNTSYAALISQAFQPDWWSSADSVIIGGDSFSQMEANFSLFWGLSIQMYESTLISDNTPLDRFAMGQTSALTAQQQQGLTLFTGQGRCAKCHSGPTLTQATKAGAERAFVNTGVRPVAEDGGDILLGGGRFKVPGLRNIELQGPYFHNGGQLTLRQVVDFYNRGGDFFTNELTDSNIRPLFLSDAQKDSLVAFMLALTDERVRAQSTPFDHPELCLADGQAGNASAVSAAGTSIESIDNVTCLAATGAAGGVSAASGFLGANQFAR
jgi:cytochrome c peroxidase